MSKKSNKKLMAGLIALITLIIIGITCSGFLNNFKEGIKFLGISFGISAGLVLLLFIMKYIIKGADKLVGEGRTFNDRAIVLFSILILVSLTCRGFLKNFTLGIVFLIVSIAFVAITFLIMYGINSKKGAIKKAILAEKTPGEKMFILLTVLILISLTCVGFIQNLKAGILFLIISIISSLALYLTVTEVKNENSIISKIIRIETTFNQKMMILLSTIIMVSLTCGGFLRNLRAGIVFLMISIVFTTSMLMLVLGVKSKHKIYDKIAGFETTFNEKMIILLTTMAMVSITSGGFLYNFKLGMLFLTISLIFSSLVLAGVISVRPRVNIFRMKARIQNLGKREAIRAFGTIFACIFMAYTVSGTWAYFNINNSQHEITTSVDKLKVLYTSSTNPDEPVDEGEDSVKDVITIYYNNSNNNRSTCIRAGKNSNLSDANTPGYKLKLYNNTDSNNCWQSYTFLRSQFFDESGNFSLYLEVNNNGTTNLTNGIKNFSYYKNAKEIYIDANGNMKKWVDLDNKESTTPPSSSSGGTNEKITIYFKNQFGWNSAKIKFYGWIGSREYFGKYPGKLITSYTVVNGSWIKFEINDSGYNTISKECKFIISLDGGDQKEGYTKTSDLIISKGQNTVYVNANQGSSGVKADWYVTYTQPW